MNRYEALLKSQMKYNKGTANKILAERYIWKNNTQGFFFKFKKNREETFLTHSKTYYKTAVVLLLLLVANIYWEFTMCSAPSKYITCN